MPLDEYLRALSKIPNRAPLPNHPLTKDKYPNKPILLLAVLDLIGTGFFPDNRIYLCPEVAEAFDRYWDISGPHDQPRNVHMPFEKLQTSGFWTLTSETHPFTRGRIASLDAELFALAQGPASRTALQAAIIDGHFAAEIRPALRAATHDQEAVLLYSRAQLGHLDVIRDAPPERIRSQAFRVTVVRAYDYRCAICGIRIFSSEGRTAVEAAHIRPWHRFADDDPDNGLSLCKLCHWAFDSGLLTVRGSLLIETSRRLTHDRNLGGHLLTTSARKIFQPEDAALLPNPDKLEWHRDNIFTP